MDLSILVNRINFLCNQNDIKPTVACRESGAGKNFISNINANQTPSIEKVYLISEYLNCSIDYLLGRSDIPQLNGINITNDDRDILNAFKNLSPKERWELIGRARQMAEQHQNAFDEDA